MRFATKKIFNTFNDLINLMINLMLNFIKILFKFMLNFINILFNFINIDIYNNITIYDNTTGIPLIRQIISEGNSKNIVKYSKDGKTIFINTLPTTFNNPNGSYYVTVDDNSMKDLKTGQPIMGVYNIWNFYTGM